MIQRTLGGRAVGSAVTFIQVATPSSNSDVHRGQLQRQPLPGFWIFPNPPPKPNDRRGEQRHA